MPTPLAQDSRRIRRYLSQVGEASLRALAEEGAAHPGYAFRVAERERRRFNPGPRVRNVDERVVVMYGRRHLTRDRVATMRAAGLVRTELRDGEPYVITTAKFQRIYSTTEAT